MADYYITGQWKSGGRITHVFLHTVNGTTFSQPGTKQTEAYVIDLIKNKKKEVFTLTYNYNIENNWRIGSKVSVVKEGNREYLRSNPDNTAKDNFDNLLPMTTFF